MPRPASRAKPLDFVAPEELAAEIERLRLERIEPAAVVSGIREWRLTSTQPGAREHLQSWPGDGETLCGVPVIIVRNFGGARVMASQQDLEDALLGRED